MTPYEAGYVDAKEDHGKPFAILWDIGRREHWGEDNRQEYEKGYFQWHRDQQHAVPKGA